LHQDQKFGGKSFHEVAKILYTTIARRTGNTMSSTPSIEVQRFGGALLMRFAGSTLAAFALMLVLSHKSYVNETDQQQPTSNGLRSLQWQDEAGEEDRYLPYRHHPHQHTVASVNTGLDSSLVSEPSSKDYFVFLQKFPMQNYLKMIFNT